MNKLFANHPRANYQFMSTSVAATIKQLQASLNIFSGQKNQFSENHKKNKINKNKKKTFLAIIEKFKHIHVIVERLIGILWQSCSLLCKCLGDDFDNYKAIIFLQEHRAPTFKRYN